MSDGKKDLAEGFPLHRVEEVTLVFARIRSLQKEGISIEAAIVAGREKIGAECERLG